MYPDQLPPSVYVLDHNGVILLVSTRMDAIEERRAQQMMEVQGQGPWRPAWPYTGDDDNWMWLGPYSATMRCTKVPLVT